MKAHSNQLPSLPNTLSLRRLATLLVVNSNMFSGGGGDSGDREADRVVAPKNSTPA